MHHSLNHAVSFALVLSFLFLHSTVSSAQLNPRVPWDWHLDGNQGDVDWIGANVKDAWDLLETMVPKTKVTVAVLDDGTLVTHPDLDESIWHNPHEIPFNEIDDDQNGYVDDGVGWNFLVDSIGETIYKARYEAVWAVALADSLDEWMIPLPDWLDDEALRQARSQVAELEYMMDDYYSFGIDAYLWADDFEQAMGRELRSLEQLVYWKKVLPLTKQDIKYVKLLLDYGLSMQDLEEAIDTWLDGTLYQMNPSFNPRAEDEPYFGYGDKYCASAESDHGTHVSGIISAMRDNEIGMDGIAGGVSTIMTVRVVPDGDELDKDVANGIRYAVNNGAKVINMSFGKVLSPDVGNVRSALLYAAEHDVLMIHAAGNDSFNTDEYESYPNPGDNAMIDQCFMSIGATSSNQGDQLVADFSNYGKSTVDLFAPGDEILSLGYDVDSLWMGGTSMATPVVSGVAALLRAYFPDLTAPQIKTILMESAYHPEGEFRIPGMGKTTAPFSEFCVSGGMVDALEAVKLALTY